MSWSMPYAPPAVARAPDFDLARALASPSFTPGQRDAAALVELVVGGEDPAATRATAALAKLGDAGRAAIETRLSGRGSIGPAALEDTGELGDAATARLVRALGHLARGGDAAARASVLARASDPHVRVRRAAIAALGKLGGDDARDALIARWDAADVTPDERRALAEALGKVGGDAALKRLQHGAPTGDAELERRRKQAMLIATRDQKRAEPSRLRVDRTQVEPYDIVLRTRAGLAPLVVEELERTPLGVNATTRDDATAVLRGLKIAWQDLYASRLWVSAAYEFPLQPGDTLVDRIVTTMRARAVRVHLTSLTEGPIRYRLGFPQGHRRSVVWKVAHELSHAYLNDPTDTLWDILVDEERGVLQASPRNVPDPRFAWRVADVPAASHPTVAAALAFVAGTRDGDRVWDPFVGSGAELIERAARGPVASLAGTDVDDRALAAAQQNLAAAGLTATLANADARTYRAGPVDLILTNPPLGSRVQLDAAALLEQALPHFAKQLAPRGRLVWITPAPRRTSPVAEQLGLVRTRQIYVDLGGVRGTLERWEKR